MDSTHWPQVVVKTMEEESTRPSLERKTKAAKDQTLNCPRCNSTNTKFCYYNNYSLSQPRYFCKSCRRYWTAGGSLRNIPVGGASRKNKRPTSSSPSSISAPSMSSTKKKDVTEVNHNSMSSLSISPSSSSLLSDHMDRMLKARELIPFMPMAAVPADSNSNMCNNMHGFRPSCNLSGDGFESGPSGAMDLFTVEDFKQVQVMDSETDQNGGKLGDVGGFWNGIFGGGSW